MATIKTCKGCGEELPTTHLLYVDSGNGYYCEVCYSQGLHEEE